MTEFTTDAFRTVGQATAARNMYEAQEVEGSIRIRHCHCDTRLTQLCLCR